MNSHVSALIGLVVTWLVLFISALATYDASTGLPFITLSFLMIFGVFCMMEGVRYSRLHRRARIKAEAQDNHKS